MALASGFTVLVRFQEEEQYTSLSNGIVLKCYILRWYYEPRRSVTHIPFAADINESEKSVKIKMPPNTRWKLTIQRDIPVKEIVVDSSGASSAISTTGGPAEGIKIEQLSDEGEFELHKSFEESGNSNSSSQLVCSGQFSMERKQSK